MTIPVQHRSASSPGGGAAVWLRIALLDTLIALSCPRCGFPAAVAVTYVLESLAAVSGPPL